MWCGNDVGGGVDAGDDGDDGAGDDVARWGCE